VSERNSGRRVVRMIAKNRSASIGEPPPCLTDGVLRLEIEQLSMRDDGAVELPGEKPFKSRSLVLDARVKALDGVPWSVGDEFDVSRSASTPTTCRRP
jgi:hypothetical protein